MVIQPLGREIEPVISLLVTGGFFGLAAWSVFFYRVVLKVCVHAVGVLGITDVNLVHYVGLPLLAVYIVQTLILDEKTARVGTRLERDNAAYELEEETEEMAELGLTLEEALLLDQQFDAFLKRLPDTDPNSPNFRPESIADMSYGEKLAEKDRNIIKEWRRVVIADDIINDADYDKLKDVEKFFYKLTHDADDFQKAMVGLYHESLFYEGKNSARSVACRMNGGPFFNYISNCEELIELKEFMWEAYRFWKKYTKPYREYLLASSDDSPTSAKSVEHHDRVREFCEQVSKEGVEEYTLEHTTLEALTCIYYMYRLEDAVLAKIGKIHSVVESLRNYFHRNNRDRRRPFIRDGESESPPPAAIKGHILCFINRNGTLFNKSRPYLSNYLVEFVETFLTAALFPSIEICPSIGKLGDVVGLPDDPRFFATAQKILSMSGEDKFQFVNNPDVDVRDPTKHSPEEWNQLITLSAWYCKNILEPRREGRMSEIREEYLQEVGFDRIAHESRKGTTRWRESFSKLKKHILQYGFKDWGKSPGGRKLKDWSCVQRKCLKNKRGTKYQWRIDLLDSVGFPW